MADLITLAEYKAYAGISSTNLDTEIKSLIPMLSQFIRTYCNREFNTYVNDAKVEVYSGGMPYIELQEFPLLGVSLVEWSYDYGATYTTLYEFTDYVIDASAGRLQVVNKAVFPKYINGYRITYTGGYETLPTDLKLATMHLVEYHLKADMAVKSQRNQGSNTVQVEYITTANLPSHIRRVLDLYKSNFG